MNVRFVSMPTVIYGVISLLVWLGSSPVHAAGSQSVGSDEATEKYEYVGSRSCKKCHLSTYKSWAKTKMAKAFDILKAGHAADAKKKYGLDPSKDYTKDPSCLKCHVTGFGAKGGYVIPDAEHLNVAEDADQQTIDKALKKALRKAKHREGIGCESCHGPGKVYTKVFKEIMKSKRKYKVTELYAVGLHKVDVAGCKTCHNDRGPTFDKSKVFHFEKSKQADTHDHKPLKQREG